MEGSSLLPSPVPLCLFLLLYLGLALLPGFALVTLAAPRSALVERLAFAVPGAHVVVAIVGLATALLHLPFTPLSYGLATGPLVLVALVRGSKGLPPPRAAVYAVRRWAQGHVAIDRVVLIPVAVAVIQSAVALAIVAHSALPVGVDAPAHAAFVAHIVQTQRFPLTLLSGGERALFNPAAVHGLDALLVEVSGLPAYTVAYLAAVVAAAAAPLLLFVYTRALFRCDRLAAAAVLISPAIDLFPLLSLTEGFYPLIVAVLFLPALALALRRAIWDDDSDAARLAALLGIGLLYTHPTEAVATVVPLVALAPGLSRPRGGWLAPVRRLVLIAAAWSLVLLPVARAVHRAATATVIGSGTAIDLPIHQSLGTAASTYAGWLYRHNLAYGLIALAAVGVALCLWRRQGRGAVAALALVAVLALDTATLDLSSHLHLLAFHWTRVERLSLLHYWLLPPLAAIALVALIARTRQRIALATVRPVCVALLFAVTVALPGAFGAALAAAGVAQGTQSASADTAALAWLARHAAADVVVLNDGMKLTDGDMQASDAALWLPSLSGLHPFFGRATESMGTPAERSAILAELEGGMLSPSLRAYLHTIKARYIFYGARLAWGAPRHLHLARLLALRGVTLVYSTVPTCTAHPAHIAACPTDHPYIFAVSW